MHIGLMRSSVIFQKESVVTDEIGNRLNVWEDYFPCAAYVNLSTGTETQEAGQTISQDKLIFTVRYCRKLAALTSDGYRILFNGNLYNILCVDDYQFRHETLKITAERIQR